MTEVLRDLDEALGAIADGAMLVVPPEYGGCAMAATRALIRRGSWRVPPIFTVIERMGRVTRSEMDRTFNNGIGFVLVVAPAAAAEALARLRARRLRPALIGEIVRGDPGVDFA